MEFPEPARETVPIVVRRFVCLVQSVWELLYHDFLASENQMPYTEYVADLTRCVQ